MNAEIQGYGEPRSAVVFRHTQLAIHGGLCVRKLAARIAEEYQARVPLPRRVVKFYTGTTTPDLLRAEVLNAQIVNRMLTGVVKLPADLEEAWVAALPEPVRNECRRELAARYGLLGAEQPDAPTVRGETMTIATLAREFGETMQALAPVLADGVIDVQDAPHIKRALRESQDLMAALVTLQAQLTAALPEHPAPVVRMRRAG